MGELTPNRKMCTLTPAVRSIADESWSYEYLLGLQSGSITLDDTVPLPTYSKAQQIAPSAPVTKEIVPASSTNCASKLMETEIRLQAKDPKFRAFLVSLINEKT